MIAVLISVALPLAIWSALMMIMPAARIEMDWSVTGSFLSMYVIYRRLLATVFYVGLALSIFSGIYLREEPTGMLALAAVYAFLCDGWMAYCYESYSHAKYHRSQPLVGEYIGPSNYTRAKYAATLALAFSAISLFVVGVLAAVTVIAGR